MNGSKIEQEIISFLRKKGGLYKPCRGDYVGDILRASNVKHATRRAMEERINHCVNKGKIKEIKRGQVVVGLKLVS